MLSGERRRPRCPDLSPRRAERRTARKPRLEGPRQGFGGGDRRSLGPLSLSRPRPVDDLANGSARHWVLCIRNEQLERQQPSPLAAWPEPTGDRGGALFSREGARGGAMGRRQWVPSGVRHHLEAHRSTSRRASRLVRSALLSEASPPSAGFRSPAPGVPALVQCHVPGKRALDAGPDSARGALDGAILGGVLRTPPQSRARLVRLLAHLSLLARRVGRGMEKGRGSSTSRRGRGSPARRSPVLQVVALVGGAHFRSAALGRPRSRVGVWPLPASRGIEPQSVDQSRLRRRAPLVRRHALDRRVLG